MSFIIILMLYIYILSRGNYPCRDHFLAHRYRPKSNSHKECFCHNMWIVGNPITHNKSKFVARAVKIFSLHEARSALKTLKVSDELRAATHNISACRVAVGASTLEEANDNGEPPAARRILQIMKQMDTVNTMVVVSRWYGGKKLGPDRFKVIDQCAKDILYDLKLYDQRNKQSS